MTTRVTTLILGAGAAGMMCAAHAGPDTLVIDHARAPGEKIRISGGGRCNFTNLGCAPDRFISGNPHFAKSALARYSQWDFLDLVGRHGIAWHEKTLGQLFCDGKSTQIVRLLRDEMAAAGAQLWLGATLGSVTAADGLFAASVTQDGKTRQVLARNLVIATGGKSIPKMGATGLGYRLAAQFGLAVTPVRPGLVPFTFPPEAGLATLAGTATPARLSVGDRAFDEALLFTHRGLSGPAVLQLSSYWREGQQISVNLHPSGPLAAHLGAQRAALPRRLLGAALAACLPRRLAAFMARPLGPDRDLGNLSDKDIDRVAATLHDWRLTPTGTEGYRTAEVTLGGIDTAGLDSRDMQARHVPGLYCIGEAVDVTGWLGGYNFQWAWSSGWAAGQAIAARRGEG